MSTLDDEIVRSLAMGQVFNKPELCRVNSMDFFHNGEVLITANDQGDVMLYDCLEGKLKNKIYCKKYGISNAKFTHHPTAVIAASTSSVDYSVRYLSLHDNNYLKEYRGHKDKVISLAMSPLEDTFLSGSMDGTVRHWDLRSNACIAMLKRPGHHIVAYDPSAVAFCVASQNNYLKLFDVRSLSRGPFSTFKIQHDPVEFMDVAFSDDGRLLVVSTNTNLIFLLDAYKGDTLKKYTTNNEFASRIGVSFSPDSQYLSIGSEDGKISIWKTDISNSNSSDPITILEGHASPVTCVGWNPKYMMMASSCSATAFWIPNIK